MLNHLKIVLVFFLVGLVMETPFALESGDIHGVSVINGHGKDQMVASCDPLIVSIEEKDHLVAARINCTTLFIPDELASFYFKVVTETRILECWGVQEHQGGLIVPVDRCQ